MTIKDTPEVWEIRATRDPLHGNKTSVRTDDVVMPDGTVVRRDYQVHPGSVAVLALDDADRVRGAAPVPAPGAPEAVGDPGRPAGRAPARTRCTPPSASCTRRHTSRRRTGGC
ncbi:hypothetical protein GCM10019016_110580 [Streptomyces prasinosporus]|uniref:Uncharacterized protein n=1 Tax=Streptomyces prasinosporus TaxID=68256 RepID=A0ABP6UAI9_9ACTN